MANVDEKTTNAYFGGGCFWCLEAVFEGRPGVAEVVSGYAGGRAPAPTYEQVCTGDTGHAEVVKITYDPEKISYAGLLELFFRAHDPTTPDRQGADVGPQYRSIILYADEDELTAARQAITAAATAYGRPVTTELKAFDGFYEAEAFHQDYYRRNPAQGYCALVIRPKMIKLGFE